MTIIKDDVPHWQIVRATSGYSTSCASLLSFRVVASSSIPDGPYYAVEWIPVFYRHRPRRDQHEQCVLYTFCQNCPKISRFITDLHMGLQEVCLQHLLRLVSIAASTFPPDFLVFLQHPLGEI